MRARLAFVAFTGCVLLAGAACSTTEPGDPSPVAPSATTTSAEVPTSEPPGSAESPVPEIEDPVDAAKFQADPCLVFTEQQAQQLGVAHPGEPDEGPLGNGCRWRTDDSGSVSVYWTDDQGIASLYSASDDGKLAFFEVLPAIRGLPAVAYDSLDSRDKGICGVAVGTSESTAFTVGLTQSQGKIGAAEPCAVAADVAAMAVETIKAG